MHNAAKANFKGVSVAETWAAPHLDAVTRASPRPIARNAGRTTESGFSAVSSLSPLFELELHELQLNAEMGNANAQLELARMYDFGRGSILARLFNLGTRVREDKVEAARLYKLAADQGQPDAMYSLAVMYERGQGGLPKDKAMAKRYRSMLLDTYRR